MPSLRGFAAFCRTLTIENGKPLRLEAFQRRMLTDYFGGTRETLILIPKKNGKTTLLAALALYHLTHTENPMCPIAAASRDQAMLLFEQARGFVQRSPELQEKVRVLRGYREIRLRDPDRPDDPKAIRGLIKVLAADEDTADGVLPTLALVDELHRHKSAGLYQVFRDGLMGRDGQMITISTAGDDQTSPLGVLRTAASTMPGLTRKGAYRHVTAKGFALHEWALDEDEDRENMRIVKRANPASWWTIAGLRALHQSPSMKPWEWARFKCGVWVFGEQGAISEKEWRACEEAGAEIPAGTSGVVIGIDLGWKWDTTAIVPMVFDDGTITVDEPRILIPPRDGSALDEEQIQEVLEDLDGQWFEITAVIDPEAGGESLAQWIERELGWEVVTHSQKQTSMARAAQRLSEEISAGRLRHGGDADLTRHVLAAAPKAVGEGWRLVKPKRSGAVIDGAIALAMGVDVIVGDAAKPEPMFAWV
jgi:phage terminase large subunit-like protein